MVEISADIPLSEYIKIKIGPETGRGHYGYYDSLLKVAQKVKDAEVAKDVKFSVDFVSDAVRIEMDRYTDKVERGVPRSHPYVIDDVSKLVGAMLKLSPHLGKGFGVEKVIEEIESDLRKFANS